MSHGTAIPTIYQGVKFPTRREARWAVYLEMVGWDWEYSAGDTALPFFRVSANRTVEGGRLFIFKGAPTPEALEHMQAVCAWTKRPVLWGSGLPRAGRISGGLPGFHPDLREAGGLPRQRSQLVPLSKWALINWGLDNRPYPSHGVDKTTLHACNLARTHVFEEV